MAGRVKGRCLNQERKANQVALALSSNVPGQSAARALVVLTELSLAAGWRQESGLQQETSLHLEELGAQDGVS